MQPIRSKPMPDPEPLRPETPQKAPVVMPKHPWRRKKAA